MGIRASTNARKSQTLPVSIGPTGELQFKYPVNAKNSRRLFASFKIPADATLPTTETVATLVTSSELMPPVLPSGFLVADSPRQLLAELRCGINHRFADSALILGIRMGGTGLDGVLVGACAIDLTAVTGGTSNKSSDGTVRFWLATRPGGSDNAIPVRSHMNWTYNSLATAQSAPQSMVLPNGAGGYEIANAVIDGTVDLPIYLTYRWETAKAHRSICAIPTDGSEWLIGGLDHVCLSDRAGSLGFLRVARPYTSGGQSIYGIFARPTVAIAVGSAGIIRKSAGIRESWLPRRSPQTANAWRACFFASWLGNSGRWIVVGDGGKIATSDDDGDTWTLRTIPGDPTDQLLSISGSSSAGIHVGTAVAGKRYSSADGIAWVAASDLAAIGTPKYVSVSGSTVVFAGTTGKISYSTDNGSTWTNKTTGIGAASFVGIAFDATLALWALATATAVYTAPTPGTASWTLCTGTPGNAIVAIAGNGFGKFATIGSDGIVGMSSNGTSFADQTTTQDGSGTFWGDYGEILF